MRATTRERYRVYTQDEFFAGEDLVAADGLAVVDERVPNAGKGTVRRRAHGARRAAGVAMLIGATGAVVAVLAIDVLPQARSPRRRGALLRVAREAARGTGAPARPLSRTRFPRALARQSRRAGRLAHLERGRAKSAASNSQAGQPLRDEGAVSRPARAEVPRSSEVPTRLRSEEFGFER